MTFPERESTETNTSSQDDSDSIHPDSLVKLQETDKVGQYLLTTEDAELLQEILKHNLDQPSEKRKFGFRELEFTRQLSTFHNLGSTSPQFHGFFVLFWMGVTLMLLKLAANNWRIYGSIWGKNEIIRLMLDKDVVVLGLTDLVLCWSTGFCLLLQRVVFKGYLRWNGLGWLIQNVSPECYYGKFVADICRSGKRHILALSLGGPTIATGRGHTLFSLCCIV